MKSTTPLLVAISSLAVLAVACSYSVSPGIFPINGATAISPNSFLEIYPHAGERFMPLGHDVPQDLILVTSINGDRIVGDLVEHGSSVRFVPLEPWAPDTTYVWTVTEPAAMARSVEYQIPENIIGSATFSTSPEANLLGVTYSDSQYWLVMSRPISALNNSRAQLFVGEEVLSTPPILEADSNELGPFYTGEVSVYTFPFDEQAGVILVELSNGATWQGQVKTESINELLATLVKAPSW